MIIPFRLEYFELGTFFLIIQSGRYWKSFADHLQIFAFQKRTSSSRPILQDQDTGNSNLHLESHQWIGFFCSWFDQTFSSSSLRLLFRRHSNSFKWAEIHSAKNWSDGSWCSNGLFAASLLRKDLLDKQSPDLCSAKPCLSKITKAGSRKSTNLHQFNPEFESLFFTFLWIHFLLGHIWFQPNRTPKRIGKIDDVLA